MIALLGLLTLVACSEDTYQEAENNTVSGTTENNSGGNVMPLTVSSGYESPFKPYGSNANKGILTTFRNNTPLTLELEPFGELIHAQFFFNANTPVFNPISGGNFIIAPGAVETNLDDGAPLAVNAAPFTSSLGTIIYDFGSWQPNWEMYHHGKIYYFKYKVYSHAGNLIAEGYLKHNFFNDNDDSATINNTDIDWEIAAPVGSIPPPYTPVVMYSQSQDEMCITNDVGYTVPLPSSVAVVDPLTGLTHTLKFTSGLGGMAVEFN